MKPRAYGPFPYSPIIRRPKLAWPGGARVALWVIPNIEFFSLEERPAGYSAAARIPDVVMWSERDYGNRVGVWCLMEVLDRHGTLVEVGRVTKVLAFRGLERVPIDEGFAGDIVAIAGLPEAFVSHTLCAPEVTEPLPAQPIDFIPLACQFLLTRQQFLSRLQPLFTCCDFLMFHFPIFHRARCHRDSPRFIVVLRRRCSLCLRAERIDNGSPLFHVQIRKYDDRSVRFSWLHQKRCR